MLFHSGCTNLYPHQHCTKAASSLFFSPLLVYSSLSDKNYLYWGEVMWHSGFGLHFPRD